MAQALAERASGDRPQAPPDGARGTEDGPLTDAHLAALLGGADEELRAAISILALSGMRFEEFRRLRVADCGRGAFRIAACAANLGPREVPIHGALVRTTIRLTRGRVADAFLILDGAEAERAPSPMLRQYDACREAVGVVGPSLGIHGLRRWFVRKAVVGGQPAHAIATVVGHLRREDALSGPKPTWDRLCACVEAVRLPPATL
jgi:integrase